MSDSKNVFETEIHDAVLVVIPVDDQIGFRMSRLQQEADQVKQLIEQGDVRNVVVDAANMSFLASVAISAFIQIWEATLERGGSFEPDRSADAVHEPGGARPR